MLFKNRNLYILNFAVILALLGGMFGTSPVLAASIIVNSNADDTLANLNANSTCDLREAIANANDDAATYSDCPAGFGVDTITFAANYTITISGAQLPVVITTITINGNGATNTILQANANPNTATYRIFQVDSGGILPSIV